MSFLAPLADAAAAAAAASWNELTDVDWKLMDMPLSSEPTEALRVILSAAPSLRSSRLLLMAERRRTTPLLPEACCC